MEIQITGGKVTFSHDGFISEFEDGVVMHMYANLMSVRPITGGRLGEIAIALQGRRKRKQAWTLYFRAVSDRNAVLVAIKQGMKAHLENPHRTVVDDLVRRLAFEPVIGDAFKAAQDHAVSETAIGL